MSPLSPVVPVCPSRVIQHNTKQQHVHDYHPPQVRRLHKKTHGPLVKAFAFEVFDNNKLQRSFNGKCHRQTNIIVAAEKNGLWTPTMLRKIYIPSKYGWSGGRRQKVSLLLFLLFERSIGSLGKRRDWS